VAIASSILVVWVNIVKGDHAKKTHEAEISKDIDIVELEIVRFGSDSFAWVDYKENSLFLRTSFRNPEVSLHRLNKEYDISHTSFYSLSALLSIDISDKISQTPYMEP
jgi:hypothetical protein